MDSDNLFSEKEIQFLFDTEIFPLKRTVTEKLYVVFADLSAALKDTSIHKTFPFPAGVDIQTGKISKGENYNGYPYVILDFPKLFDKEKIFSFRSMFWFGHYFSFSILIGGETMKKYLDKLNAHLPALRNEALYFSVHADPWKHEIEKPYNVLVEVISPEESKEQIEQHNFIKLTRILSSADSKQIIAEGVKSYSLMLEGML